MAKRNQEQTEQQVEREAVTERGVDLLARLAEAGETGVMLTAAEGMDAVQAGYATVDNSVTEGETAKVTITPQGLAALNAQPESGGDTGAFALDDDVPLPEASAAAKRGRKSQYPFDAMSVNQSFHVAPKAGETPDDVLAKLHSSISGARARHAVETGEMEEKIVKTYRKDESGAFVKDDEGKRIVESETVEQRPVMAYTRDFKAAIVGSNDKAGVGVRIWRIK